MWAKQPRPKVRSDPDPLGGPQLRGARWAPTLAGAFGGAVGLHLSAAAAYGMEADAEALVVLVAFAMFFLGMVGKLVFRRALYGRVAVGFGLGAALTTLVPGALGPDPWRPSLLVLAPFAGVGAFLGALVGLAVGEGSRGASEETPEDRAFAPPGARRRIFRRRRRPEAPPAPPGPLGPPPPPPRP